MIRMNDEKGTLLNKIRQVSWWTFYSLFLLVVLYLLFLMLRSLTGGEFVRASTFGQFMYHGGLVITVVGLLGLCIGYLVRVMWYRLKTNRVTKVQEV
ncbi:MAG: hypothetical protein GTN81_17830 [Proteobacteria bacterium]|nr:hypothetical protein [Pseudomonadota bacterium]